MKQSFTNVKDVDRLILDAADDETLLNILQMNKNFVRLGEEAFKRRMFKYYPYLAAKKPFLEPWGKYYLSNVYYINKLKEEFGLDYYPVPSFYPEGIYRMLSYYRKYIYVPTQSVIKDMIETQFIPESGNETEIRKLFEKKILNYLYLSVVLARLLKVGNIPLFEKLIKLYEGNEVPSPAFLIVNAAASGKKEIVNYIINFINEKIGENFLKDEKTREEIFNSSSRIVAKNGDINMLNYLHSLFPEVKIDPTFYLRDVLFQAALGGQINFIKYFILPENKDILEYRLPGIISGYSYVAPREPLSQNELENTFRFLLDTYLSLFDGKIGRKKLRKIMKSTIVKDPGLQKILKEYGLPFRKNKLE